MKGRALSWCWNSDMNIQFLTVHCDGQQVLGRVFARFEQLSANAVEVGQEIETAASGVMEPYWKATRSR